MITSWNTNGWRTHHCLRGLSWKAPYMPQWLKASHHPCQVGFFLPFHGWQRGSKHWPAHREAWKLGLLCWARPLPPFPSTPGSQPLSCSSMGSSACHFWASSMVWSSRIKPLGHLCFPSSSLPRAGIAEPYRFFSWDVSRTFPFSVLLPLILAQNLVSRAAEWCPREGGALFPSPPTLAPSPAALSFPARGQQPLHQAHSSSLAFMALQLTHPKSFLHTWTPLSGWAWFSLHQAGTPQPLWGLRELDSW